MNIKETYEENKYLLDAAKEGLVEGTKRGLMMAGAFAIIDSVIGLIKDSMKNKN